MPKESAKQLLLRHSREISKVFSFLVPANERTAGLMAPQDKTDLIHALGTREWVNKPISILDLGPGNYAGFAYNLLDEPYQTKDTNDGTVLQVDVTVDVAPRKQITVHYSGLGQTFYRNIHQNDNANPQGWQAIIKETKLWSGTAENVGQTLTLSESLRHFTRLKIAYNAQSLNKYVEVQMPGTNAETTVRDFNLTNSSGDWASLYETRIVRVDDTHLRISGTASKLITPSNVTDDSNRIIIAEIIGIR